MGITATRSDVLGWKLLASSALAARSALDMQIGAPHFSRRRLPGTAPRARTIATFHSDHPQEIYMKRLALVAAVVLVAACSTQEKPADTAAPAMAPAPAMSADTGMAHDSAMAAMDTTKKDSTAKADTTKKP